MRCLVGVGLWMGLLMGGSGAAAQETRPKPFTFELPEHPGVLRLQDPPFQVTELSAKPNGQEFGIRADEKPGAAGGLHLLAFLFVWPEAQPLSSAGCRDRMLQETGAGLKVTGKRELQTKAGSPVAVADYTHSGSGEAEYRRGIRAFVAEGDLCADLEFSSAQAPDQARVDGILREMTFEPAAKPDFWGQYLYAKVLEDHHALLPAAHAYELAAANARETGDALKWRRVATDQASMDYGMAGDLKRSRALNEAAIVRDPEYPLPYYNLACADAEEGHAAEAKRHLQEAFARKGHVLPGENLPDPTKDDSIVKLKGNREFWTFVESLPKQ